MKLLKFGTRYTKVGGIRLGIPDLVPAKPNDPGPLYVLASEAGMDKQMVALALKYLIEYREDIGFQRDACYHPGVVALQDKAKNLDVIIKRFKKEIAT